MTTSPTLNRPGVVVGDRVTVPATVRQFTSVGHLLEADHQRRRFWVRPQDVDTGAGTFRGRVVAVWPEHLELAVLSRNEEYYLTVPTDVVTVLPHVEQLAAGHLYRPAGEFGPFWLYDGEAFYPVETFPAGAQDRDQLPARLEDVGHLRDL